MTLPLILRQNPVQSLKDFKRGLNNLTPKDHAIAKKSGHMWAIFGATSASFSLLFQIPSSPTLNAALSKLGFGLFVGAIGYLQFVEWRKERQKIKGIENMKIQLEKETEARKNGNSIITDS